MGNKSSNQTVGDLQQKYNLSNAFMQYFLLPQCGSIWSMPSNEIKDIPSDFITQFTFKHRLSCLWGRPCWKTVTGRSQVYVSKVMDAHFKNADKQKNNVYKTECKVTKLIFDCNESKQIKVECDGCNEDIVVDHVLFCCHAEYALEILNNSNIGPTQLEKEILSAFECGKNTVILHGNTDVVMPKNSKVWAAWNYHQSHNGFVNVAYWLNILQNLDESVSNVFATLNPTDKQRDILEKEAFHIWHTQHPKYNEQSWNMIKDDRLNEIQCVKDRNVSFAGAWTGYGFHRDGFLSGTKEAWRILGKEYKPKPINIDKGSSYWFSYVCCLIHDIMLFIISFLRISKR